MISQGGGGGGGTLILSYLAIFGGVQNFEFQHLGGGVQKMIFLGVWIFFWIFFRGHHKI